MFCFENGNFLGGFCRTALGEFVSYELYFHLVNFTFTSKELVLIAAKKVHVSRRLSHFSVRRKNASQDGNGYLTPWLHNV